MKFLRVVFSYFKGMRFAALLLMIAMTFTLYQAANLYAKIQAPLASATLFRNDRESDTYYVHRPMIDIVRQGQEKIAQARRQVLRYQETLRKKDGVELVGTTYVFNGSEYSVKVLDRELLSIFPALVKAGIPADLTAEECVTAGSGFAFQNTLTLNFGDSDQDRSLKIRRKLDAPYLTPDFMRTSSTLTADSLTKSTTEILLLSDESWSQIAEANESAFLEVDFFFVFQFREDATAEERQAVLDHLKKGGFDTDSFEEILQRTDRINQRRLKTELPLPLLFLAMITLSYFMILLTTLARKQRYFAVEGICGASQRRMALQMVCFAALILLIPVLINLLLTLNAEAVREMLGNLDRKWRIWWFKLIQKHPQHFMQEDGSLSISGFINVLYSFFERWKEDLYLNKGAVPVILGYAGGTLLVTAAMVFSKTYRKAPIELYREGSHD